MKVTIMALVYRGLTSVILGLLVSCFTAMAADSSSGGSNSGGDKSSLVKESERQAEVVFDNTALTIACMSYRGVEMGSSVTLSGEVTNRYFLRFKFKYFVGDNATGKEKAQLRFYLNDGPSGTPGKLPFFAPTPISLIKGTNTYIVEAVPFVMPDAFTWTVQFTNVKGVDVGLLFNGPPTIGFGSDSIWERVNGQWTATSAPQSKSGFAAQVIASKEYIEAAAAEPPAAVATPNMVNNNPGPQPVPYEIP
jgi:hypothetical protein